MSSGAASAIATSYPTGTPPRGSAVTWGSSIREAGELASEQPAGLAAIAEASVTPG